MICVKHVTKLIVIDIMCIVTEALSNYYLTKQMQEGKVFPGKERSMWKEWRYICASGMFSSLLWRGRAVSGTEKAGEDRYLRNMPCYRVWIYSEVNIYIKIVSRCNWYDLLHHLGVQISLQQKNKNILAMF